MFLSIYYFKSICRTFPTLTVRNLALTFLLLSKDNNDCAPQMAAASAVYRGVTDGVETGLKDVCQKRKQGVPGGWVRVLAGNKSRKSRYCFLECDYTDFVPSYCLFR
jgi:hypothetical protein